MFWGLYYTPPGAVYLYLNITGTIYLAGTFICVIGGLYWKRANTTGGYLAMLMGAAGAIIPFFFLNWSENITGFCAFGLAALGLVLGSLIGKRCASSMARDLNAIEGGRMNYWLIFWTAWLAIAGVSFAVITGIVMVKGYKDLRSDVQPDSAEQRTHDHE